MQIQNARVGIVIRASIPRSSATRIIPSLGDGIGVFWEKRHNAARIGIAFSIVQPSASGVKLLVIEVFWR